MTKRQWINWYGGKCPIHPDSIVSVKLRDNTIVNGVRAGELDWDHYQWEGDIIGYCIHSDATHEQRSGVPEYTKVVAEQPMSGPSQLITMTVEDLYKRLADARNEALGEAANTADMEGLFHCAEAIRALKSDIGGGAA